MGEEFAADTPFQYFISHYDQDLVEAVRKGRAREFAQMHQEILTLKIRRLSSGASLTGEPGGKETSVDLSILPATDKLQENCSGTQISGKEKHGNNWLS